MLKLKGTPDRAFRHASRARVGLVSVLACVAWACAPDRTVTSVDRASEDLLAAVNEAGDVDGAVDLILHGGQIITLEGTGTVEAIAISGERIRAVGSSAEILSLASPTTRVVDLAGRTVVPGFVAGHSHLLFRAFSMPLDDAMSTALSYGITTLNELVAPEDFIEKMLRAEEAGEMRVRTNLFAQYNEAHPDANGKSITMGGGFPGRGPIVNPRRRVRVPGIKIFVDGAYNPGDTPARGCPALTAPYAETFQADPTFSATCSSPTGALFLNSDELTPVVRRALRSGFRVAMHASGDAAVDAALDAVERTSSRSFLDRSESIQIHHNILLRPDQLRRYGRLGPFASARAKFNTCGQEFLPFFYGEKRTPWSANRYSLPRVTTAISEGDFDWTTDPDDPVPSQQLNPLMNMYALVTHKSQAADGSTCEPVEWLARHRISPRQALRMVTINPAASVGQEGVIGTLRRGKFADLAVLSGNPLTVPEDAIKDLRVVATLVGGTTEHCKPGEAPVLCAGLGWVP